jgi:endonuclease/exonuclease/phosphatase family metal-dependent hydrolase
LPVATWVAFLKNGVSLNGVDLRGATQASYQLIDMSSKAAALLRGISHFQYVMAQERKSNQIRVLTYNIHKGIGGIDRRYDLSRIIDTVGHYEPDIVFLQEVDHEVPRSNLDVQVEELADQLGYPHWAFQANVKLTRGNYGNAILTKFPIRERWNVELTIPLKKRRRALVAKVHLDVEGHERTLFLCNLHLGLAGFERTLQVKRLLDWSHLKSLHRHTPAIVGGDFNDVWGSLSRRLFTPFGFRSVTRQSLTFPAFMPVRGLDAIYIRGDIESAGAFVGHTQLSRYASDHLPLIVDLEIQPQQAEH